MFELRLLAPEDRVEALSDALDALDALSVSVEDADAQTDAEQALFGEPGMPPPKEGWQRSRVLALFAARDAADEAVQLLQAQDFFDGCKVLGIAPVPDQDWVRRVAQGHSASGDDAAQPLLVVDSLEQLASELGC